MKYYVVNKKEPSHGQDIEGFNEGLALIELNSDWTLYRSPENGSKDEYYDPDDKGWYQA